MPQSKTDQKPKSKRQKIEEILEKDLLRPMEARTYCMEALDIGKDLYYDYVYQRIKPYIYPLFVERNAFGKAEKYSDPRVRLERVEAIVANIKKEWAKKARERAEKVKEATQ